MGYVPTPERLPADIASWFTAPKAVRIADPAAGTAQALKDFSDALNAPVEKWAIELSPFRAEEARANADAVLAASFYNVRWAPRSVSLVYNNPPYDDSDKRDPQTGRYVRHEQLFMIRCTHHLVPGGHQIGIVPRKMLGDEKLVRHLLGWYEEVFVMRFPDGLYEQFKQIVIFCIGRRTRYVPTTKHKFDLLHMCYQGEDKVCLPVLTRGNGEFVIPEKPKGKLTFNFKPVNDNQLVTMAYNMSPLDSTQWKRMTYVPPMGAPINPAIPPKVGHLAMQISSNDAGVMRMNGKIAKGTVHKVMVEDRTPQKDKDGVYSSTKVEQIEKLQTQIAIVNDDGSTELITDGTEVAGFITEHASEMGDVLMGRNAPTYNFDPTPDEWATTGRIATRFKPLPGRKERGLFKMQKDTTIAVSRVMRKYGHGILNFEMGTGKTLCSVSVADLIDEWPVLTVVPGHMLYKWQKTWQEGSDPDSPVVARIISRPVTTYSRQKMSLGKWLDNKANEQDINLSLIPQAMWESILASGLVITGSEAHAVQVTLRRNPIKDISEIYGIEIDGFMWENTLINDASWFNGRVRKEIEGLGHGLKVIGTPKRFQVEPVAVNDQGRRVTFIVNCQQHGTTDVVMSLMKRRFSARMTDAKPIRPKFSIGDDGLHITIVDRDEYTIYDFFADLDAGNLGKKAVAVVGFEPAKWGIGINTTRPAYRLVTRRVWDDDKKEYLVRKMAMCPTCGGLHDPGKVGNGKSKIHFCNHFITEPVLDDNGKIVEEIERKCNGALVEFSRERRESLSRVVQRKFKDRFKLYIIDEMHKAKGGDTEIGAMDGRLCSSIKYSLALTGTIFGGEASSLFYLLYRRNREIRERYAYIEGRTTWVDHFGLWKHRWFEKEDDYSRSSMTGQKKYSKKAKELPGVSPAVIRYLLPITIFGKITDLGYKLPRLHEEVDVIPMSVEQQEQYDDFNTSYLDDALELLQSGKDKGGVSSWFANIRFRPNSSFRDEEANYHDLISYELPAVISEEDPYLPKETRLIEIIKENIAQGKKTLVFAEQTGTRDIRSRLVQILEENIPGIRAKFLKTSIKPAKREAWINQHAPHLDVLISNPKLVETGLDLVMFSDIRFYGLPLSLYTLWQAMRRVWRLGQTCEVTCGFMVYKGTIEHALLSRVGSKLKAAMTLYGDQASGAIVETDESDIQADLIRKAMVDKTYDALADLNADTDTTLVEGLFSQPEDTVVVVNESPMGSPVATSPYQITLDMNEEPELVGYAPDDGPVQLNMFGGYVQVNRKGKHIKS